ncbi:zymogen granule membrane protein 16-like isoform X1 [Dunckerocampus dactyliophorus]|uniref:zymogen granule membrane protein 16-like isoform X1 n=1 Tax=Dunckerocampus dactyliophorus TaxID=161453 RepID=UPI0024062182|nr:zymogen granule membrane protein 16-like isoform X1 [Dunckerocampus dactyliophorus]XP_054638141.1 zymogen granule membrane protein 16-like isoform X1 [Dunckerocampus dactyliophorus]
MFLYLLLSMLCATLLAQQPVQDYYSFSPTVGSGSGTSFMTKGIGRITAVRVWEQTGSYITGIQFRYDHIWTNLVGRNVGEPQEIMLHSGEKIIQVSGKYYSVNYIYQLIFVTSTGRTLICGQPTQVMIIATVCFFLHYIHLHSPMLTFDAVLQGSFNFYPIYPEAELRLLSGRSNGVGITALGAHWGLLNINDTNMSKSMPA